MGDNKTSTGIEESSSGIVIKLLKALHGDCIIINYGEKLEHNILVDGGMGQTCRRQLKRYIKKLKSTNKKIEMLILTHTDHDHIDGILDLLSWEEFKCSMIKEMLFNFGEELYKGLSIEDAARLDICLSSNKSTKISIREAESLEKILKSSKIKWNAFVKRNNVYKVPDGKITILSPGIEILKRTVRKWGYEKVESTKIGVKSDYLISVEDLNCKGFEGNVTVENRSSISFIFKHQNFKVLLLGDASADEIEKGLIDKGYTKENPIKVDFCKISHHASKHNTSNSLVERIDCHNYLISTCMTSSGRPSKECLSRIICNSKRPINFFCNYSIDYKRIFTKSELKKYKMKFILLEEKGVQVKEYIND